MGPTNANKYVRGADLVTELGWWNYNNFIDAALGMGEEDREISIYTI